ncbi:MAG: sugar phosphate isomerase/epimerase family protein [Geminicoccaceae bacterium]|nr:sugar phosphate isomerase/epimerase family protein [Geminicoccaceae bacterium]
MSVFPFAINGYAWTMSHDAPAFLRRMAERGWPAVELMVYPGHLWPATLDPGARRDLRRLVERQGLRLVSLNMPNLDINLAAAAPEMRRHTLGLLHGVLELAGDLEVPGVVIGPGKANPLMPAPPDELKGHFFRALDELAPHAARLGTSLYVENMPFAFLPRADQLMAALDGYGDPAIRVIYDLANAHFAGEDPKEGLRRVADRLALVHLSDTGTDVYRHAPIGIGTVPFEGVPAVLEEVGYRDLPMFEIVADDPEQAVVEGAARLAARGWPERATRP